MTMFTYKAVTASGEIQEGVMEMADRAAVIARLQSSGHIPILAEPVVQKAPRSFSLRLRRARRLKGRELAGFTSSLASLLGAGMPLDRALAVIVDTENDATVKDVAGALRTAVRGGAALSEAMEQMPGHFNTFYVNMVRTAEHGGGLEQGLMRLAEYLEGRESLRSGLLSTLTYPAILLLVAGISIVVILAYVVPQFAPLFADMGDRLPWATRLVLAAADGALAWGWGIAMALALCALATERLLKQPAARRRADAWLLRAPLVGGLVARLETARFTYNLGTLLASGLTVPEGLRLSRDALGNRAMAEAVDSVAREIRRGGKLSEPLAASGRFPKLAVQMIAVGEESGSLDRSLLKVAEVYEREVAEETRRILTVLEPVLIVSLGAVIAGIILSILVGIVSVNDLPM